MAKTLNPRKSRKKKTDDKIGRPSVVTPDNIDKLEEGFIMGYTDEEACLYAGISTSALYRYQEDNPEFRERKALLKKAVTLQAKQNVTRAINKGDKKLSKWWLERRASDEFSTKVENEHAGKDGNPIQTEVLKIDANDQEILDRYFDLHYKAGGKDNGSSDTND